MSIIKIDAVERFDDKFDQLTGYSLDVPEVGEQIDGQALRIGGWVLGKASDAVKIQLRCNDNILRSSLVNIPRPDVAAYYQEVKQSKNSGFWTACSLLGTALNFEIIVEAVLDNQVVVPLGIIRGHRDPLISGFQPAINPLMVSSLGRTGTTILMLLLSEHPDIVVQRIYPYETRAASYWLHLLKVLSAPANHVESSHPDQYLENKFTIGHNPYYIEPVTDIGGLQDWFSQTYIKQLATFSQQSIQAFYQEVAKKQLQTQPVYFAEKYQPGHITWLAWELYPQTREIFLIRDFRDMICSMLAFNLRRGETDFWGYYGNNQLEFIEYIRESVLQVLQNWKMRSTKTILIRYEDLIWQPNPTLKKILDYLGLDSSANTIDRILEKTGRDTPELLNHRTSQNVASSIGRWRRDMDINIQKICNEMLGDLLKEFDYD